MLRSRFSQITYTDSAVVSVALLIDQEDLVSDGVNVFSLDESPIETIDMKKSYINEWLSDEEYLYLVNTPRKFPMTDSLLVFKIAEEALYNAMGVGENSLFDYYFTTEEGKILSSSDRSVLNTVLEEPLLECLSTDGFMEYAQNKTAYCVDYDGRKIVIVHDTFLLRSNFLYSVFSNILLIACIITLTVLCVHFRGKVFSNCIRSIQDLLSKIKNGEFHHQPMIKSGDELQFIDECICDMGDQVSELNQSLIKSVEQRKNLEIRSLQMQINRHFLYNSLSSLRWMAVRRNQDDLAELMESLISFYKVTLCQNEMITLRDEIKLVGDYIQLENLIHNGNLHFHCDIPEEILPIRVCKMLLQPFVENSIHHGKIQRIPLDIWLSAEIIGDSVIMRIEDNGLGMRQEVADRLQKVIAGEEANSESIGIYNTVMRLKELYGPSTEVLFTAENGTRIEIIFPLTEQ